MTKVKVVEEGSCMTLATFPSLEIALSILKKMTKTYYIYQEQGTSSLSCGVWKDGKKIASQKYW